MSATWLPCPCCGCYWCTRHGQHAHDCPCPPIEEWAASPYGDAMPDPIRSVRISDADWSALERIAASRGDTHGGVPSRGKALVRLIREAEARIRRRDAVRGDKGEGE